MRKALEKDPRRRSKRRGDAADLQNLRRARESGTVPATGSAAKPGPDSKETIRRLFVTANMPFRPKSRIAAIKWLAMALVAIAALVAITLYIRSPKSPPLVLSSLQITSDGISKRSLVTDGTRLYFSEYVSGHSVLRQVSTSGGETVTGHRHGQRRHLRFLPARSELLIKGVAEGSEMEWPVWILPLPAGTFGRWQASSHIVQSWSPDDQRVVYVEGRACMCAIRTNRFAGTRHRAGSSFCSAILSRWPSLAVHRSEHYPANYILMGGFVRR